VRLHFAEIYWNGASQRKFHVNINGTRVLTDFDVYAAGAKNKGARASVTATSNGSGLDHDSIPARRGGLAEVQRR
jgi:hypothetical protein